MSRDKVKLLMQSLPQFVGRKAKATDEEDHADNGKYLTKRKQKKFEQQGRGTSLLESDYCDKCRMINRSNGFTHHLYDDLHQSAKNGCLVCQYLCYCISERQYQGNWQDPSPGSAIKVDTIPPHNGIVFDFGPVRMPFEIYKYRYQAVGDFSGIHLLDLDPEPASENSVSIAAEWIRVCRSTHQLCFQERSPLPTRVLSVQDGNLLLREGKNEIAPYITLSHCWGNHVPFTTKKANLASRCRGIKISKMPQTFQDAVRITRKLGISYLWIDSLCILQDSLEDWTAEAAKMGEYYSNSFVTISALAASSSDQGFIHKRETATVRLSDGLGLRTASLSWSQVFSEAPLNRRAWVVQERYLSTRILHYGKSENFWECQTCSGREGSSKIHTAKLNNERGTETEDLKREIRVRATGPINEFYDLWYRVVDLYSKKSLTRQSDVLPAISGLASLFARILKADYKAGLWLQDLQQGLLWVLSMDRSRHPEIVVFSPAPSWSWACVKGVEWPAPRAEKSPSSINNTFEVLNVNVTAAGSDPRGAITSGTLTLSSLTKTLTYTTSLGSRGMAPFGEWQFSLMDSNGVLFGTGFPDTPRREHETGTCKAIFVSQEHVYSPQYFLLVQPAESPSEWRRIGIGKTIDGAGSRASFYSCKIEKLVII